MNIIKPAGALMAVPKLGEVFKYNGGYWFWSNAVPTDPEFQVIINLDSGDSLEVPKTDKFEVVEAELTIKGPHV